MGSIPKIVSTPLKWVSKKILNHTLLRFPGGDAHQPMVCVYCPEMCRFSCPTAVVSANDAVTPCNKMGLLYKEETWPGKATQGGPLWPIYDCTGCGRCTEYCVYDMPVALKLFEARKKYKWEEAEKAAARITDAEDPVGDLADELGDSANAKRRLEQFLKRQGSGGEKSRKVTEPKSLYFLQQNGVSAVLHWEKMLMNPSNSKMQLQKLKKTPWLLHESVWYNRHLGKTDVIKEWLKWAQGQGIQIQQPFAKGDDCIDCGGEGAYPYLFSEQARQMASDIWERDKHTADGILCVSARCAQHLRSSLGKVLGEKTPIIALSELFPD